MIDPEAHADAAYDHYDDLGQFNADEIRQMTGMPDAADVNADFTVDAIRARHPELEFTDEAPEEDAPAEPLSPREMERNQWLASMYLSDPSSEGPIRRTTPEERARTRSAKLAVQANIRPLGGK